MQNKKEGEQILGNFDFFSKNKKAQGMSTTTIVLLILGVIVMVVLIFGFSTGWSSFKKIMSPTNVDSVVEDCSSVCGLNQKFSFCQGERALRVNEDNLNVKTSCYVLANLPEFSKYHIQTCPAINCDLSCKDIKINNKPGSANPGKYNVGSLVSEEKCFVSE